MVGHACLNCAKCGTHCPLCRPCGPHATVYPTADQFEIRRLQEEITRLHNQLRTLRGHKCPPCYREHCSGHCPPRPIPWVPSRPPWKPKWPSYRPWIKYGDNTN